MDKYSFKKGYAQIPVGKIRETKKQIMIALNIKTTAAWLARLRGDVEPRISEYKKLEEIFLKMGITDIWGD